MIVVITGGSGFIGKKLVLRHLERGDEVRLLSRQKPYFPDYTIRWLEWDVNDSARIHSFIDGADVIYHCAAEVQDISRMPAVNVGLTKQLLQVVSGKIPHWIQLSSIGVYGRVRRGLVTEDTLEAPNGVYECSKLEADQLVIQAAESGNLEYTILRPSNVFGEGMTNQSLYKLISLINKGRFVFIGSKGVNANYIHVDNVVEAMILCANNKRALGKIYNLSDCCSIESFVVTIADVLERPMSRLRVPESLVRGASRFLAWCSAGRILTEPAIDALSNRVVYSRSRIEADLGFKLTVPMEQGLQRLVREWQSSLNLK